MKNIFRLIALITMLFALNSCFIGETHSVETQNKAPNFILEEINGGTIELSDLLKKREVVLVFWATWCPHCRTEIPHIEKFYSENKEKKAVVGINGGESKTKVASFVQKTGISYPIALDSDTSVAGLYGVKGVPTICAINKDGKIIYFGHSIEEMIQETE